MKIEVNGFVLLLFLVFLVLKLTEVIDWSWWWVTAPLWGGYAIMVVGIVMIFVATAIATGVEALAMRNRHCRR